MNSQHLDYDTLADLAEGLLDDERAASAGEHLTGCPVCREREAELADVSRILAEAPVPAMPSGLAARIDAALAAERSDAVNHAEAAEPPGFQVAARSPRRLRRLQLMSAAAAAVVVVGGGATVAKIMSDSSVTAADGKASVPDASSPHHSMGPKAAFGSHGTAGGLAGGGATYRVISTGATYRDATLAAQVRDALKDQTVPMASVPTCVPALIGGRVPEVVDVSAHYRGSAATVVVFQSPTMHGYDIVIAGPGCATGRADVLTRVFEPAS